MTNTDLPAVARQLLNRLRANQGKAYRLAWTGTKIPRGAKVDGDAISWTQHGCVYVDTQSGFVGYYVRTKEWTGANKDEHEMIIATGGTVEAGPNQTVELLRDFTLAIPSVR